MRVTVTWPEGCGPIAKSDGITVAAHEAENLVIGNIRGRDIARFLLARRGAGDVSTIVDGDGDTWDLVGFDDNGDEVWELAA